MRRDRWVSRSLPFTPAQNDRATLARVALVAGLAACGRTEPPSWDAAGASPSIAPLPASIQTSAQASPAPTAPSSAGRLPSALPTASATATAAPGSVDAGDPGALPQTRDRPTTDGAVFNAHVAALWSAIVDDDPEKARSFFFPVSAYEQVKDIPQPSGDWTHRLWRNFARDVHAIHARVAKSGDAPKFEGLDVPSERAAWMDPGREVNKLGYYRVLGSKLRYTVDGETKTIDVTSLISWRGEWYVVHLSGFK